jgi:hypothetical protein
MVENDFTTETKNHLNYAAQNVMRTEWMRKKNKCTNEYSNILRFITS